MFSTHSMKYIWYSLQKSKYPRFIPHSAMDQINLKPIPSTKTIKISSRTSVQSEPILTSDGEPSLKYKPVILYPDKDSEHKEGVFSLEDDITTTKNDLLNTENYKKKDKHLGDELAQDEFAAERNEDTSKTDRNNVLIDKGEDQADHQNNTEAAEVNDNNKLLVDTKAKLRWRGLSPVEGEPVPTEKGKGDDCGFCEQDQVNPKLLPCFHSFCKECIWKLIYVRNG